MSTDCALEEAQKKMKRIIKKIDLTHPYDFCFDSGSPIANLT